MRALALFALLLAACDEEPTRYRPDTHPLPSTTDAYRETSCWFAAPPGAAVECGYVTVPVSPGSAQELEIAVARFLAPSKSVEADPFVLLTGGPGQDAATIAAKIRKRLGELAGNRDVIAIDQRGTGRSRPSLACAESETVASCRARLVGQGVDLSVFRTARIADDFEAVRVALGYPAWNLFGISYGTRLALTLVRDHPAGVRSVVLSSVVPLEADTIGDVPADAERSLERIFDGCAAQPSCAAAYPALESDFDQTVAALNATPATLTIGGQPHPFRGDDLVELVFQLLYDASSLPYVPRLLDDVAQGDLTTVTKLVVELSAQLGGLAYGMHLSVQCADEVPFSALAGGSPDAAPLFRDALGDGGYATNCATWGVPPSGAIEDEAVSGTVPLLLISGAFDPITPPSYASQVAASFPGAYDLVFPNAAHSTGLSDDCSGALIPAFVERLALTSEERSCVGRIPDVVFVSE